MVYYSTAKKAVEKTVSVQDMLESQKPEKTEAAGESEPKAEAAAADSEKKTEKR